MANKLVGSKALELKTKMEEAEKNWEEMFLKTGEAQTEELHAKQAFYKIKQDYVDYLKWKADELEKS